MNEFMSGQQLMFLVPIVHLDIIIKSLTYLFSFIIRLQFHSYLLIFDSIPHEFTDFSNIFIFIKSYLHVWKLYLHTVLVIDDSNQNQLWNIIKILDFYLTANLITQCSLVRFHLVIKYDL